MKQLQAVVSKQGAKGITVLMGNVNAKIGSYKRGYEQVMGRHGLGTMNENGELFADFCTRNSLVIGGSVFPHRCVHKATWRSPDHVTEIRLTMCVCRAEIQGVTPRRESEEGSRCSVRPSYGASHT